jgi:hypothetical protein
MEDTELLTEDSQDSASLDGELVGWIMTLVERWRNARDAAYKSNWEKYYCIWKGEYSSALKGKDAERSKLITPATQQAVDSMVAEMSEATFGRGMWFDVDDDTTPQERAAAEVSRVNLLGDFDRDGVPSAIREAYLNGAIYGTGIAKRIVGEGKDNEVRVYWEAVSPYNFVIDTAAKNIDEALGCAHETIRPIHEIQAKQRTGEYTNSTLGDLSGHSVANIASDPRNLNLEIDSADGVYITEYHGLVPARLMIEEAEVPDVMEDMLEEEEDDDLPEDMVEAIVTIGNGSIMLKKVASPFGDRGLVAYAHDKVPSKFWGRGICEKTYNSQAGLDAEIRGRIDALGLLTYPVVGVDITRMPRNLNLKVQPGKALMTNGRPSEIIEPLTFGNLNAATFQQSGDFERMVQMAAGSYDAATPQNINTRNETASGVSMSLGSMIKRAKLTMFNVDQDFLDPLIRKSLTAYNVLDQQRYPVVAPFNVNSTMSIMAREFEQTQMTNLLSVIPQESPAYLHVLKAIVENYSGPSKDKLVADIEAMMEPDPKKQQLDQMVQQIQLGTAKAEMDKILAEIQKIKADIALVSAKAQKEQVMAQLEDDKVSIDSARVVLEERQTRVQEAQTLLQEKDLEVRKTEARSKKDN